MQALLECWSDGTAGQMDRKAGWWTSSRKTGLPPLARIKGMGRQQQQWYLPRPHQHYGVWSQLFRGSGAAYGLLLVHSSVPPLHA